MYMKYLLFMVFTTLYIYAGGKFVIEAKTDVVDIASMNDTVEGKDFFVFGSVGASLLNVKQEGSLPLSYHSLDDKGSLMAIGLGYKYGKTLFSTLSLQRNTLDMVTIDNIMFSYNYQFNSFLATPYIGVLAGMSRLRWTKEPYVSQINKKLTSQNALYGVHAGFEQSIGKNFFVYTDFQYIMYNHSLDIYTGNTIIKHKNEKNILLGVKYAF